MKPLSGVCAALRAMLLVLLSLIAVSVLRPALAADPTAPTASPQAAPAPVAPHNAAPMWREVRHGDQGFTTIKGAETGVLVQMEGNAWRHLRNDVVTFWGGLLVVIVAVAILLFHRAKGQLRLSAPPSGRKLERFSKPERLVHGVVAGTFVLLAIGGLLLLFGKHVLTPILGHTLVALLMQLMKPIHNFLGLVFVVGLVIMILMWARDNLWASIDAQWIRRAGGLLDRTHVPSWRFNFGEKTWFWFGVTILGLTVAASGILLDFPSILETRAKLQAANIIHSVGALLMLVLSFGHVYMGTIGVEGAMQAMKTGSVDEVWAKDHHELWYRQVTGKAE